MTLSDTDLENRLRDQRTRTAEIPPPPVDLAQRVRVRAREERRRRVALTAAGVAAALVFVGLPALAEGWLPDGSRGEQASPSSRSNPAPSHLDLPTRGSLADDEEWLADVRALSWVPEGYESYPPRSELPDSVLWNRSVVFAGDVPGGRVALVVARRENNSLIQAWFIGAENARPAEMRLATATHDSPRTGPLALIAVPDPASDEAVLVLVTQPGDEAEALIGREVTASGETRELWEPVPLEDGVGAIALGAGLSMPPIADVRITRAGQRTPLSPDLSFSDDVFRTPQPLPAVADPRGLLGIADADQVQWAVENLVSQYGVPADELHPTLLAAGPVRAGSTTSVVLVGATFPSGATTTSLGVSWGPDDEGTTVTAVTADPAPAGVALLDRLIAVATSTVVAVSAPSTGATAQVYGEDGSLLTTVSLVDGAGIAPLGPPPRPYELIRLTVRVLDGGGNVLGETTVEQQQ